MDGIKATEIAGKLVQLLEPLSKDERQRVLQASLTLLGDSPIPPSERESDGDHDAGENSAGLLILPNRARTWAKQNDVTSEQLDQIFLMEKGKSEVIASDVPGKNDKEKTYSAYVLTGIASLLATGESKFDDESARALCKSLSCFNAANHSAYLKDKGNEFSGSKEKGGVLTSPGLKRGAAIVRGATQDGS